MGGSHLDDVGRVVPLLLLRERRKKRTTVLPAISALHSQGVRLNTNNNSTADVKTVTVKNSKHERQSASHHEYTSLAPTGYHTNTKLNNYVDKYLHFLCLSKKKFSSFLRDARLCFYWERGNRIRLLRNNSWTPQDIIKEHLQYTGLFGWLHFCRFDFVKLCNHPERQKWQK